MPAPNFPQLEEQLLKEWEEKKIFEKTLEKPAPKGPFVFFEGPPTANGKPGIHHVLARAFKDLIPRFKTMQGYRVDRKAGWDTHGLPVELEVEKQLGLKNKKDVEAYGIEKFNAKCKESVWKYLDEWVKLTKRMAFWVDLEHPYVTYHNDYIESLWWVMSEISKKGLLYRGHKVVPYCARCGTALSSHEVAQGYKEVEETSVYVRFKIKGEENLYALAWTTTPWTLPSNTALAVGPNISYVKARKGTDIYIVARDRLSVLGEPEILAELKGKDLVGLEYEPLFSFLPLKKPAHKIVPGSFVSTTDGTGIVHMAPFGEEDMEVIKENNFPVLMTIGLDGAFIKEVTPWAGKFVKDADPEIIKALEARGLLYKTEKYEHDYPFCWRCSTPLLYYPKDSWFIRMSALKDKLVANNEKINWEPAHIKEGRFGEWLRGIKDWALSRERYWGTPLPIWACAKGHTSVVGSLDQMNKERFRKNRFFAVRHGEATSNANGFISSWPEVNGNVHLTPEGEKKVRKTAEALRKAGVDLIVSSDLKRTAQTAEIIKEVTGAELVFDERLREIGFGEFNGKTEDEYHAFFGDKMERFTKRPEGGENYNDVRKRVMQCALEYDRENNGKTIVFVSHGDPLWFLTAAAMNKWDAELWDVAEAHYIDPGASLEIEMPNWPFDHDGALDVHRPFIDAVTLKCAECGGEMMRVPDVIDVWFDSGAMPFAQWHYPFENKEKIDPSTSLGMTKEGLGMTKGTAYPADFISEAIDQTRGWFYTLLAVSTLLDKGPAYKNVICLGHLLDAKGQKMSKSKGNVVNPWEMFDKHGADAVRFHLYTVNQPGEAKRFDEKEVDGVVKKLFLILWNVLSFWKMYSKSPASDVIPAKAGTQNHVLDRWILSELNQLTKTVTDHLEKYDVVTAGRAIGDFANDLSTWYVRRSRDRFKDGDTDAVATLGHALLSISKLMAPLTPFVADGLYKELGGSKESVHLENWPQSGPIDEELLQKMKEVRWVCALGHTIRADGKVPVRQVLLTFTVYIPAGRSDFSTEMLDIVREEVNVKEVKTILNSGASGNFSAQLDTVLTPELKREGAAREMVRNLNSLRKEAGLTINDRIVLHYETESHFWKDVIKEHGKSIQEDTRANAWHTGRPEDVLKETEVEFDKETIWIGIVKA